MGGKTKECCSDNEVHEGLKGQAPHPSDSSTVIVMWRLRGRDEFTEIRLLFSFPILEAQRAQNKKDLNRYTGGGTSRVSYQGEALGGRRPPLHRGEGPLLNHIFGPLVHSHHGLFGDPQETRHQLVFALHLFLRKDIQRTEKENFEELRPQKTRRI